MRLVGTQSTQKDTEIVSGWICHSRLIQPQKAWMEILTNQLFFFWLELYPSGETHSNTRQAGLLDALALAMRSHPSSLPLQRRGCSVLHGLCSGEGHGRAQRVEEVDHGVRSGEWLKWPERWVYIVNPPIKDGKRLEKEMENVWKKSGKVDFIFWDVVDFFDLFCIFEGLVDGEMGCCSLPTVVGLNRNIKSKHGHLPWGSSVFANYWWTPMVSSLPVLQKTMVVNEKPIVSPWLHSTWNFSTPMV